MEELEKRRAVGIGQEESQRIVKEKTVQKLEAIINDAFEKRAEISPANAPAEVHDAVAAVMRELEAGTARIAEKLNGEWRVHEWLKKAVLLYFRLHDNRVFDDGWTRYFDKIGRAHV